MGKARYTVNPFSNYSMMFEWFYVAPTLAKIGLDLNLEKPTNKFGIFLEVMYLNS
jgi:hypothetical protein